MEIVDAGVYSPSFMDFNMPSRFATENLYHVNQFGHFYCDENYHIARDGIALHLLVYVCSGSLYLEIDGKQYIAEKDQVALLDCTRPHAYYCKEHTDFLWFHYGGNSTRGYSDYLYEEFGVVFSGEFVPALKRNFERVIHYSREVPPNEHMVSVHVAEIIGRLASPGMRSASNKQLEPAVRYIRDHFQEPITLEELADLCSMSKSHFIRSFGKYANRTPHEYLLAYRLAHSKQLLLTTDLSIEQIAEECGFNSASHFARAFRKANEISPTEFRVIPF